MPFPLLVLPILLASPPAGTDVLATYRGGTVTRGEYESWLLANGQKDDEGQRRARLETIALAETLEAAALGARLDRSLHTAFRLAQIETGLLASALRRQADREIVIGDAEVEAELKAEDKERYKPRTVRLRNIFKRVPADAPEPVRAAARARMEALRAELLAGADFEELAWRESDSQTRFRGGAMGYVPPGVLAPEVERIAFALGKGELTPVLASADGFTLLRCDDIDEGRVIPLDEARTMIRRGLWTRASDARQARLRAELLQEAAPRYVEPQGGDDAPVAELRGGGRITLAELRWLAARPIDGMPAEARRAVLEEQVVRLAAAARARARGLHEDAALQAQVRWERARLLATAEIARRVNLSLVPPGEAEMRAHYEKNRDRYLSPTRVDVALIRWPLGEGPQRRQFEEADAMVARLRAGELPFDEAARRMSTDPSAARGGRLGLQPLTDLAYLGPNVYRTIEGLAPGQLSGVVQQDKQLFVVKLLERQASRPLTYEESATVVEKELGDARVAALQQEREAEAKRALELTTPAPAATGS